MNILALDTSGPVAGCAVMRDDKIVYAAAMNLGLTHSQTILPAVDTALRTINLTCADMDVFAAITGPGSFTGVRIGVCMAKGFARATGKPCCAINALEALAMNAAGFDGLVCPILDARVGQVYAAAFETVSSSPIMASGLPMRVMEDCALPLEEFLSQLPGNARLAFVGDGVPVYAEAIRSRLGERAVILPASLRDLRAEAACVLAAERPETWVHGKELVPYYLRLPQAERERAEKLAREGSV